MTKRNRLLSLAALAAVAISPLPSWIIDSLLFPWVHADPSLFDRWSGRLADENGEPLEMVLVLHRRVESNDMICVRCNQIEGTAVTCAAGGDVRRYRIDGSPRDRGGRDLLLGAQPAVTPPPDGPELDTLRGSWDGADTLELSADFALRSGASAISSTDDPVYPVTLSRQPLATGDATAAPACE